MAQKMKIVYVDMDNVLVNFQSGIDSITEEERESFKDDLDDVPGIFSKMKPVEGAIEAYQELTRHFEVYILSTAPWNNPSAWADKLLWVKKYLGGLAYKRLILSHNKHLNDGDFLIDDRTANGADKFKGEHIHFLSEKFKNWDDVLNYLIAKH
jgi:5'(3')-deoxyribonucleotidase